MQETNVLRIDRFLDVNLSRHPHNRTLDVLRSSHHVVHRRHDLLLLHHFLTATSLTLSNVIPVEIVGAFRTKVDSFFISSHVRPQR